MSTARQASTPARVTRARSKTPLPAVGAKQTNAYGAKGKTELRSQVRTGTDDFAAAFAGQRSIATRDASTTPSASARSSSEEPGPAQPVPIQRTAMESMAGYSGGVPANRQPEIEREPPGPKFTLSHALILLAVLIGSLSTLLVCFAPMPWPHLKAAQSNIILGIKQIFHTEPFNVPPAIPQNNDWLANEYSQELRRMWSYNMDNLKTLAENAATEIIDRSQISYFAKQQVDFLQKANSLHNTYEALRSVNYFSAIGGARVDPYITSPTVRKDYSRGWLNSITKFTSSSMRSLPPINALTPWTEANECWCGSPTEQANGGVNIGVLTSHRVYPDSLVIEHIPAAATLDIAAAPRVFEVWADVGTKKAAKNFEKIMIETDHLLALPDLKPAPLERFVCIGTGEYHIHNTNHIQSFKLWSGVNDYSIATNRIVVRAATNWGANHTCFYRLRLTGTKA